MWLSWLTRATRGVWGNRCKCAFTIATDIIQRLRGATMFLIWCTSKRFITSSEFHLTLYFTDCYLWNKWQSLLIRTGLSIAFLLWTSIKQSNAFDSWILKRNEEKRSKFVNKPQGSFFKPDNFVFHVFAKSNKFRILDWNVHLDPIYSLNMYSYNLIIIYCGFAKFIRWNIFQDANSMNLRPLQMFLNVRRKSSKRHINAIRCNDISESFV